MKLFQKLEAQLKKEPNFVSDDGELKKWVVLSKAENFDEELIGLLLEEPELKETFFKTIKGATVFKQNLFTQFLEQKDYLCEILDKNQLYVNLSSLHYQDFACSEEEKKVTEDFYQK
jgi:adenine-specific DNA-methyltransferase